MERRRDVKVEDVEPQLAHTFLVLLVGPNFILENKLDFSARQESSEISNYNFNKRKDPT